MIVFDTLPYQKFSYYLNSWMVFDCMNIPSFLKYFLITVIQVVQNILLLQITWQELNQEKLLTKFTLYMCKYIWKINSQKWKMIQIHNYDRYCVSECVYVCEFLLLILESFQVYRKVAKVTLSSHLHLTILYVFYT